MQVFVRHIDDVPMASGDILYGLKRFTMEAVPREGECFIYRDYTVYKVLNVSWVPDHNKHVPMVTLAEDPLD